MKHSLFTERVRSSNDRGELHLIAWAQSFRGFYAAFCSSAQSPYGTFFIDTEHCDAEFDTRSVREIVGWASARDVSIIVRVQEGGKFDTRQVLDFGAEGILVPQSRTAQDVADAINKGKYPSNRFPYGRRGVAGVIGNEFEQRSNAIPGDNELTTFIIQIETKEAVENIDEIVEVEGIDALFIGPSDLSCALGKYGERYCDEMRAATSKVLEAASRQGIPVATQGIFFTPDQLKALFDEGYKAAGYFGDIAAAIQLAPPPQQIRL